MSTRKKAGISIPAAALYFAFAAPMYYFVDGGISAGGFGLMYHYLFGIGIVVLAFFAVLFGDKGSRILQLLKSGAVLSASYIIPLILSCFIWAAEYETTRHIIAGVFLDVYVLIGLLTAIGTVYLFGEYAPLISCLAMSAANLAIIAQTAVSNPSEFMKELTALVVTFGENTGSMMKAVEIHDLTFAFGEYLLFALIDRNVKGRKWIFCLSLLFSVTGLKRIAVIGIILGVVIYWLLKRLPEKAAKTAGLIICIVVIVFTLVWITVIHAGFLDILETKFHVDTKGRNLIFRQLNKLFTVSPFFLGKGIGWSKHMWDTLTGRHVINDAIHNEYVRMYIENGFIGYLIWIFTNTVMRFLHFDRQSHETGRLFIALMLYLYATYATDNTYLYYYTSMALFILTLAKTVKNTESITTKERANA